jgi:hypothetical protein
VDVEAPLIVNAVTTEAMADAVIDTDHIRENLEKIRDALSPIMSSDQAGLALDSLEVSLGLTVGGQVGFIAKGSVEGTASITLTFKRPSTSA